MITETELAYQVISQDTLESSRDLKIVALKADSRKRTEFDAFLLKILMWFLFHIATKK